MSAELSCPSGPARFRLRSHITNELLSLIIDSNSVGLTLSEIEGDAVLFYKKGEAISSTDLVKQCLEMFEAFHARLRLIERDTICRCGACQSASDLSPKFVVHRGVIKEFETVAFETTDDSISYTEKGMVEGMPVGDLSTYRFARLDDGRTRLTLEHSWLEGFEPPAEIIPEFHEALQESLRLFKIMCEKRSSYPDC